MIKEFIGTGKTIEEATISARAGLNAPLTADVKIEVVAMPKKKILGLFGGSDAQVKASYDDGVRERKPNNKKKSSPKKQADNKKPERKPVNKPAPAPKAERADSKPEDKIIDKDIDLDSACAYLKTMIDGLRVKDAQITAGLVDGVVEMDIVCDDYGIIIGRRGETLDSLQYLTSLAIKNNTNKYVRVTLNVGDYRDKRAATLRSLAVKNANFVARTGRRFTFEPMNPYERRIIHTTIQGIDGVISRSVGSGMDRRVVIEPEGGVRRPSGNGNRRGGNRSRGAAAPVVDPNREKKVDRADMPKFGKIEINK